MCACVYMYTGEHVKAHVHIFSHHLSGPIFFIMPFTCSSSTSLSPLLWMLKQALYPPLINQRVNLKPRSLVYIMVQCTPPSAQMDLLGEPLYRRWCHTYACTVHHIMYPQKQWIVFDRWLVGAHSSEKKTAATSSSSSQDACRAAELQLLDGCGWRWWLSKNQN